MSESAQIDASRLKQIIVLRTDLEMRRGKEIAQGAHASLSLYRAHPSDPAVEAWAQGSQTKIAVGIESEEALVELDRAARAAGLPTAMIVDHGRTEFGGVPTRTALAVGPGDPDELHRLTGHLKLR